MKPRLTISIKDAATAHGLPHSLCAELTDKPEDIFASFYSSSQRAEMSDGEKNEIIGLLYKGLECLRDASTWMEADE